MKSNEFVAAYIEARIWWYFLTHPFILLAILVCAWYSFWLTFFAVGIYLVVILLFHCIWKFILEPLYNKLPDDETIVSFISSLVKRKA